MSEGEGARERAMAAAKRMKEEVRRKEPLLNSKQRTSRDDPNFMQSFFKASRLHFIGTWKARYQEILDSVPPPPPLPPPLAQGGRIIAHVDMDCFFCSVGVKGRPELDSQPVAVCWGDASSGNAQHAEISSANYVARKFGVRAGMFIGKAKELCPTLITIPYEFDKYTSTAETMYRCLFAATPHVQGVSVDEAFADITSLVAGERADTLNEAVMAVANRLRKEILEATGCPASVGCAGNRFLAKIATSQAKPDGSYFISKDQVLDFLAQLPVSKLPGVGYNTVDKLSKLEVHSVQDLRNKPKAFLQITWGVRFNEMAEVFQFIEKLSVEVPCSCSHHVSPQLPPPPERSTLLQVSSRMHKAKVKGRTVQVTLLRAVKNAPDNARKGFLGHGICEHLTRSVTLSQFTDDAKTIEKQVCSIVNDLRVPAPEIRGLGVQLTKLDSQASSKEASASRRVTLPAPPRREFDASKAPNWLKAFANVTSPSKQAEKASTSGPGTPEVASPVASEKTSKRSFADVNEMYASWYSMGGSPKSSPSSPNKTSRRTDRMARQDRRLSEEGHDGVDAGVPERTREEEQGHQHRLCEEKQGDGEGAHRMHESDASLDEVLAVGFKEIELAYHQLIAEQLAGCEGCACPGHIEAFMSLARVRLRGMGEEVQRRGCQRGQMVFTDLAFNILLQMSGCHVEGQGEADALNVRKALTGGWSSCVEEILRTFDEEHEFKQPMMNQ